MCYTGICLYETYPFGYNEGCVCARPRGGSCPCLPDEANEFQYGDSKENADDDVIGTVRTEDGDE